MSVSEGTNAWADAGPDQFEHPDAPPLDAGFADVEKEAEEKPAPTRDEVAQAILFHPHIAPHQKVLLLQLNWLAAVVSQEMLAKASDMSKLQVLYGLKPFVELGFVSEGSRPNYETKQFERTFELRNQDLEKLNLVGAKDDDQVPPPTVSGGGTDVR